MASNFIKLHGKFIDMPWYRKLQNGTFLVENMIGLRQLKNEYLLTGDETVIREEEMTPEHFPLIIGPLDNRNRFSKPLFMQLNGLGIPETRDFHLPSGYDNRDVELLEATLGTITDKKKLCTLCLKRRNSSDLLSSDTTKCPRDGNMSFQSHNVIKERGKFLIRQWLRSNYWLLS